jgi:hypothetical protein
VEDDVVELPDDQDREHRRPWARPGDAPPLPAEPRSQFLSVRGNH